MTAELIGYYPHGSPEWHKARLDGLGGSEIAAVLGLSKWDSHFALWHRKQGRIPDRPANPDQEWGTRLEPAIMGKFRHNHPQLVVPKHPGTWRSVERPWQISNPDGLAHKRGKRVAGPVAVVEAKNVNTRVAWEWDDGPPPYYLAQVRWYLDVFDLDTAYLAVLFGGSDYREFEVHPDPDDTFLMRDAGQAFMRSLENGIRPDIDEHGATWQAVRNLHPFIADEVVDLDVELAKDFCTARLALRAAEQEATHLTTLVADAMGNARAARAGGVTVATRQARGDGLPYVVAGRRIEGLA